ncbi:hypothetical protein GCM10020229_28420 [Kitasatospora albolonga]
MVLTHLHSGPRSGSLAADGATPAFPNARYWSSGGSWTGCAPPAPDAGRRGRPAARGRLPGRRRRRPAADPRADRAAHPGHTPGHQSLAVGERQLVVAGDVVLHPVQLADPTAGYLYDEDQPRRHRHPYPPAGRTGRPPRACWPPPTSADPFSGVR